MNKTMIENKFGVIKIFIVASIILFLTTHFLIPYLTGVTGWESIIFWFICAGLLVFLPMMLLSIWILKKESHKVNLATWRSRLRFRKLTSNDWKWTAIGFVSIGLFSYLLLFLMESFIGPQDHQPSFMKFEPLTPDRYWILLLWLPYWVLNIMGEEILWRGVLLPKQEIHFRKSAWLIHGVGWGIFHIAFGWSLLITLIPILLILPFIVQKTENSWIGVILHAGLNGPSFIAISFGLL